MATPFGICVVRGGGRRREDCPRASGVGGWEGCEWIELGGGGIDGRFRSVVFVRQVGLAGIQDSRSVACLTGARARLFFLKSLGGLSKAIRTPRLIVEYPINERQLES